MDKNNFALFIFAMAFPCDVLCVEYHNGLDRLFAKMEWLSDLNELDAEMYEEDVNFRESIVRTFPAKSINCYAFSRDSSLFSERVFKMFQESNTVPAMTVDNRNSAGCSGVFVVASSLVSFKQVLLQLPRWSTNRLYCLIWRTDVEQLKLMLRDEVEIFADAEAILFVFGEWTYGFKLGQPNREFEMISNFTVAENVSWDINFDGYRQFYGREVRFTTTNCSIFCQTGSGLNLSEFSGFDWWIFSEMSRRMNVTLRFVAPEYDDVEEYEAGSGSLMGFVVNGSWVGGTIGHVFNAQADITFCGNWIESNKINPGIELSVPVQKICVKYLVPRPERSMVSWHAIFTPFTGVLWFWLGITIVLYSSIITWISRKSLRFSLSRVIFFESWDNSLLAVFGTLVQGFWPKMRPNRGPTRWLVTSWIFFGFLVATSFSGKLFAHLSKPTFSAKPTNIKELLSMGYTWPEIGHFPINRLVNMEDPSNKIWSNKQLTVNTREQWLNELKNPGRVIFGTDIWGEFLPFGSKAIPDEILENYETMSDCVAEVYEGFVYRKGSPFNRDFNFYLQQLLESGMIGMFARKAIAQAIVKHPALGSLKIGVALTSTGYYPLSMANLQGLFEVLSVGHSISILAFLCEIIIRRRHKTPDPEEIRESADNQIELETSNIEFSTEVLEN